MQEIYRPKLYFNQWQYCVRFVIHGASCLRGVDMNNTTVRTIQIQENVQYRRLWPARYKNWAGHWGGVDDPGDLGYGPDVALKSFDLQKLGDFFAAHQKHLKYMVSRNVCHVYTNDPDIVADIENMRFVTSLEINKVVGVDDPDTIVLKNPKHNWRSYLKSQRLNENEFAHFIGFLDNLPENFRMGPALKQWKMLNRNRTGGMYRYTQSHFFVDHYDHQDLDFVNLVCPGIIRHTMKIIKR